jgi:predicted transcriptional regulator
MTRNLREVIAALPAKRRAKIAAAYRQKLIAVKKNRQLEEAKRFMEFDHKLIVIAVLITALPIIAALAWMLTALAVGDQF